MNIPCAIESCATWPTGIYPVAQITDEMCHVRAMPQITKRGPGAASLPERFDPIGSIDRGPTEIIGGIICERMGGAPFAKLWLELVRAAFPGVLWCAGNPVGSPHLVVAYGCISQRVVGVVMQVREATP